MRYQFKPTEIICIIDKSGSMYPRRTDVVEGFKAFVEEQRKVGDANLTLVLFNHERHEIYAHRPLSSVAEEEHIYHTDGMTALLDAVGATIDEVGRRFDRSAYPPKNVIVAIMTDGEENSSRHFTPGSVRERIEHQQSKYGWKFIYMGANQDAWAVGGSLGIDAGSTYSWDSQTSHGTRSAYSVMGQTVTSMRTGDYDTGDDADTTETPTRIDDHTGAPSGKRG